ncbi:hypothetical protein OG911_28190 [Streptomyces sp. NBC_00208]|uniref:hypothetical protein n=1 Tax=Streptomyces sp. NBC_00208 TaxID=2975681 RepID=UPI002E2B626A|nr:hypothetical protein [Streptomyces sp. NBC_00208]
MTHDDEVMTSLGLEPSVSPKRPRKPIRHGSHYGYQRCHKRPQGSCPRCRAANAEYSRENRAAWKNAGAA